MLDIFSEIQIIMGKSPSHIIIELIPALRQFLEFGYDFLVAALPASVGTHFVIYFLAPVYTENHIRHFFIYKFMDFIIQKNPVGGKRKAELLVVRLFQASSISYQILNHLPVHQRLSAKKVHLKIHPVTGIGNQEIQGLLSHFKAHQRPSAVVFSLFCEAVPACKVAVMGNMQAKSLYHRLPVLKGPDIIFINIIRIQLSCLIKLQDFLHSLFQLTLCIGTILRRNHSLRLQRIQNSVLFLYALINAFFNPWYHIIDTIVHNMYASAVHIHYDVVAVVFVLVYHWKTSFLLSF